MKKLFIAITSICFAAMSFAANAVKCNSLSTGYWHGDLGNLTRVHLLINVNSDNTITGHSWFNYDNGNGYVELDMLEGTCVENANGTTMVTLNRNSYGVSGNISAVATDDNTLSVKSFSYNDPWDHFSSSGTLTKN